jgi:hypothetical protein
MSRDGFSMHKFVGVTPTQLANLHTVLTTEPVRRTGYIEGEGKYHQSFAEIKTVAWDMSHESLTIEVAIYDYAIWRRGVEGDKRWYTHDEHRPTERWVVTNILNALERFEGRKNTKAA